MFAKINTSKNIVQTLRYNEQKLDDGKAACLHAENFVKDLEDLVWKDKLFHFQRLISLNERVKATTIHISLNFHPSETISDSQITGYSREFMQEAGLGEQPYLVYRHFDSKHPHTHIVISKIKKDGSPINMAPKFFYHANELTREMEISYSLVKNGKRQSLEQAKKEQSPAKKVIYAEGVIKPAIITVLDTVMDSYQYSSLGELNAVLKLYNVQAVPIQNKYKVHRNKGLYYQVLDERTGKGIGVPIWASDFESKPTLKNLEKQFALHASERKQNLPRLQAGITAPIDWALMKKSYDLPGLIKALQKERITLMPERDKKGVLQRIYYIDQNTKSVFEGAALGPRYTAAAMQARCPELTEAQKEVLKQEQVQAQKQSQRQRPNLGLY